MAAPQSRCRHRRRIVLASLSAAMDGGFTAVAACPQRCPPRRQQMAAFNYRYTILTGYITN